MSVNNDIMKVNWGMIFVVFLLCVMPPSVAFADHEPWFTDQLKTKGVLLNPGAKTYCNKNFMIENMSLENAEVQVIMGNEENYYDTLEPDEKLAYFQSPFDIDIGNDAHVDDVRIVNTGFETVKVHCK